MNFTKHIEKQGNYMHVYFTDELGRKQGVLECYLSESEELLREKNLYYTEKYINDVPEGDKEYTLLKEHVVENGHPIKEEIYYA